jgi:hypothetical protein
VYDRITDLRARADRPIEVQLIVCPPIRSVRHAAAGRRATGCAMAAGRPRSRVELSALTEFGSGDDLAVVGVGVSLNV